MLKDSDVQKILDVAMSTTADFAEVFQEETRSKSVSLLNSKVIRAGTNFSSGTGIRLLAGTNCVYVYSNDNDIDVLLSLAKEASHAIKGVSKGELAELQALCHSSATDVVIDPMNIPKSDTVDFLRSLPGPDQRAGSLPAGPGVLGRSDHHGDREGRGYGQDHGSGIRGR